MTFEKWKNRTERNKCLKERLWSLYVCVLGDHVPNFEKIEETKSTYVSQFLVLRKFDEKHSNKKSFFS